MIRENEFFFEIICTYCGTKNNDHLPATEKGTSVDQHCEKCDAFLISFTHKKTEKDLEREL